MNINIKQKLSNTLTAHPKLITLGIGLAITFVIGTAIGMVDHQQVFAVLGQGISQQNTAADKFIDSN